MNVNGRLARVIRILSPQQRAAIILTAVNDGRPLPLWVFTDIPQQEQEQFELLTQLCTGMLLVLVPEIAAVERDALEVSLYTRLLVTLCSWGLERAESLRRTESRWVVDVPSSPFRLLDGLTSDLDDVLPDEALSGRDREIRELANRLTVSLPSVADALAVINDVLVHIGDAVGMADPAPLVIRHALDRARQSLEYGFAVAAVLLPQVRRPERNNAAVEALLSRIQRPVSSDVLS